MLRGHRSRQVLIFTFLFFGAACSSPQRTGDPKDSGFVTLSRDSLGVVVADITGSWFLDAPTWEWMRVYSTEGKLDLHLVSDGLFLSDGSLAITNTGTSELLHLDTNGQLLRRIGGAGEGPGEFRSPTTLALGPGAAVWVYDRRLRRLTGFDDRWRVAQTRNLRPYLGLVTLDLIDMLPDGRTTATFWDNRGHFRLGLPETRDTVPIYVYGVDGEFSDSIGPWFGTERSFTEHAGGIASVPVGFGRTFLAAGRGGVIAAGSTDSIDVVLQSKELRPVLRLRGHDPARVVGPSDEVEWRRKKQDFVPITTPEYRRIWEQGPTRKTFPAFGALAVDDEGRVWIGEFPSLSSSRRKWVVFDASGRAVGQVVLPTQFRMITQVPEVLDIAGGQVALLFTNDWDEQHVEVLRLLY